MKAPIPLEDKTHAALGSFHETLARIRAWDRPLHSVGDALGAAPSQAFVALRHDVRRNLKSALTMAQWEAGSGVRGTFFLRPVGSQGEDSSYYGRIVDGRVEPAPQMLADVRAIAALGHEIGLLGSFDGAAARLGMTAQAFVLAQVELLRDAGIVVRCIAEAGAALAPERAGVAHAMEQLEVDATWGEAQLADPALATPWPARLLVSFESDSWSRVGGGRPRQEERAPADAAMPPAAAPVPEAEPAPLAPPQPAPPLLLVGRNNTQFTVALRGDDVGRRMLLAAAKSEVPKGISFWTSEATSCRSLAQGIDGVLPDAELARALVRLEAMPVMLRDVFLAQFSREMVKAKRVDLLVVDTQVEYDRTWWRHREQGWTIWFPSRFVRGIEALESLFEVAPAPDAGVLAASILTLLRALRHDNPGLPAVVLCVENGSPRVPANLAQQLDEAFAAAGDGGLYVQSVDAGGTPAAAPEESGRRLMQAAWSAGLHRHLTHADAGATPPPAIPAPVPVPASAAAAVAAAAAEPASKAAAVVPLVHISYQRDTPTCTAGCARSIDSTATSVATYFLSADDAPDAPRRYTPTLLPMAEAWDFDAWEKAIKPLSGGNRLREKRKAIELGYTVRPFEYAQYVPDIHEINHSKQVRSGGPMRGSYQRSIEEMGGAPKKLHTVRMPACPHHWGLMFGVFRPAPGRTQGEVVVDDQLVGYISLRRVGGVAMYSQILGHGDYLHDFVLVLLHHEIIRWLSTERAGHARDLEFVMYGGAESGGESLLQWKRRAGFRPMRVVATGARAETTA